MSVVNIGDFRDQPEKKTQPCEITFIGFPFKLPDGTERKLFYTATVDDGDYVGVISHVRANGGIHLRPDGGQEIWFMPWPCAAVRIRYLDK